MNRHDRIAGVLLGTAVGDALGLPREGLSARRAARLHPGPVRHAFAFGRGAISDDTEHASLTAQALLAAGDDPQAFRRSLARRLRWWLLGAPPAIGWGTLRSLMLSWFGLPAVRSAGNGAAMRSSIIGACVDDLQLALRLTDASTSITHGDARAFSGARAITLAAHHAARATHVDAATVLDTIRDDTSDRELLAALDRIEHGLVCDLPVTAALSLEHGVTGYIHHTVPASLYCWLHSPADPYVSLTDVIGAGGDSDTTAAIVGALAGATVGASELPPAWLDGVVDWPRSINWLRRLAGRLASRFVDGEDVGPEALFWPAVPLRNAVFLTIALGHALRRALPPY